MIMTFERTIFFNELVYKIAIIFIYMFPNTMAIHIGNYND